MKYMIISSTICLESRDFYSWVDWPGKKYLSFLNYYIINIQSKKTQQK